VSFDVRDDGSAPKLNLDFYMHHDIYEIKRNSIPQSDTPMNHTFAAIDVATETGTKEVANIKTVAGPNLVVVSVEDDVDMPTVNRIDFSYGLDVHPLIIGSCKAETSGCHRLYDGVNTHWTPPTVGPARVNFRFGHPTDADVHDEPKRHLNRLHLHYQLPDTCYDGDCKKLYGSVKGGVYLYSAKVHLRYDDNVEEEVIASFSDKKREATFMLNRVLTTRAQVTFSPLRGKRLASISEVMFWNAVAVGSQRNQTHMTSVSKPNSDPNKWTQTHMTSVSGEESFAEDGSVDLEPINAIQKLIEVGSDISPTNYVAVGGLFAAIKEAAQRIAMGVCLGCLSLVQGLLHLAKGIINGIAAVVIGLLQAAIKMMGPHFFKINNLMFEASFDAFAGLGFKFGFEIDMWLLGLHIGPWGFNIEFTIVSLIGKLWEAVTGGLKNM